MEKGKGSKILSVFVIFLALVSVMVFAVSATRAPSACSGLWTSCTNAFVNDANRATAAVTGNMNRSGSWNNYGYTLTQGSAVNSVVVKADFFA